MKFSDKLRRALAYDRVVWFNVGTGRADMIYPYLIRYFYGDLIIVTCEEQEIPEVQEGRVVVIRDLLHPHGDLKDGMRRIAEEIITLPGDCVLLDIYDAVTQKFDEREIVEALQHLTDILVDTGYRVILLSSQPPPNTLRVYMLKLRDIIEPPDFVRICPICGRIVGEDEIAVYSANWGVNIYWRALPAHTAA